LRSCTGDANESGKPHYQLTRIPKPRATQKVNDVAHKAAAGNLEKWLCSQVEVEKAPEPAICWRTKEGITMCAGSADFLEIWITIPQILIIELDPSSWDIPKTLSPFGWGHAKSHGLIFDLVGKGIFSPNKSHFTAVFRKAR
jgi:hypothetical protein